MFRLFVDPVTGSILISLAFMAVSTLTNIVISDVYTARGEKFSRQLQEEAKRDAATQFQTSVTQNDQLTADQNKLFEKQKFESRTPYGVGEERFRGGKK